MGLLDFIGQPQGGGLLAGLGQPQPQPGPLAPIANNQNAILGYLAGALQGGNLGQSIGRGLEGWMRGGQLDQRQQAQQQSLAATYKSLIDSGLPEPVARAAAHNPEILRTVAGAHFDTKPAFGVIGEDDRGRKIYGFVQPGQRKVTPIPTGATAASPAGASGAAYLAPIDPMTATYVQAMFEGRLAPPAPSELSNPFWQNLLGHAAKYEPGFNLARWQARAQALKNPSRDRDAVSGER